MEKVVWDLKPHFEENKNVPVFDCLIAEFLLSYGSHVASEEVVLQEYSVKNLADLSVKQKAKFSEMPKLQTLFNEIEMPLVAVLCIMEKTGITLDTRNLKKVGEEIDKAIIVTEEKLRKEMDPSAGSGQGVDINLNSSVQVGNFLAEKMGVPLAKTKTGRYATNETELIQFAETFPTIQDLLTYRELTKLRSTYVDSLIAKVDTDGRVHTTYHQLVTNTGRLASSNPNLQNIPVTSEFGIKIKSCFVASPGHCFISFDYSQQELRILAHLTQEEKLIEAFKKSQDIHKITAAQIFHVAYEEVTKEQRSVAKTINFGVIYGMGSYGLSQSLRIPIEEAELFIKNFYKNFPKIKIFYDGFFREGMKNGFVETLLGRRWRTFAYPNQKFLDNATKRVLLNYPIQGTAADLMKKAMVEIYDKVLLKDPEVSLLLQIHDDLVFEVPDPSAGSGQVFEFIERVKDIMCNVYPLLVPVEVDVKMGKNWGEMVLTSSQK